MQIAYELTRKDFTQAFFTHRNRNPAMKWTRRIILGLVTGFMVFLLFGAILAHNLKNLAPLFLLIIGWLAIVSGALTWWSARRQFLKQPGAHGPRTLTLDDLGMHWRWNGGSGDVEWRNYVRWVEGKNHFLFYTSPACFNILPKRGLEEQQLSDVRELLKRNIAVAR
jgi:YcxB-like protein